MEKQLLDCLLANLIGFGKQFLPKGQVLLEGDGQKAFFDILTEKMGGVGEIPFMSVSADTITETGSEGSTEDAATDQGPVAACLDRQNISLLVSSLLSLQDPAFVMEKPFENKDAALTNVVEFLKGMLEVLSDGDEIEIESGETLTAASTAVSGEDPQEQGQGKDTVRNDGHFIGYLMSVLNQLRPITGQGNEMEGLPAGVDSIDVNTRRQAKEQDTMGTVMKEASQAVTAVEVREDLEAPVFLVEIVKAAKKTQTQEISQKKDDSSSRIAASVPPVLEETSAEKDDLFIVPVRERAGTDSGEEPKKIVIRVLESKEIENGDGQDGRIIPQNDAPGRNIHQAAETKPAGRNDFNEMMVDKIEKMTEQFAGRNTNSDMLVRLRIDEKETLLVGFKEEGSRITVELKTTNENIVNILQSQKDDITKNLEGKNIFATIHVDIDQNGQKKQDKHNNRGDKDDDAQEGQDFSAFVEALA